MKILANRTGKMLGCRVPPEIDEAVRSLAISSGKTVNDIMVESLRNRLYNPPEPENYANQNKNSDENEGIEFDKNGNRVPQFTPMQISNKVMKLKAKVNELKQLHKESGSGDLTYCIELCEAEITEITGVEKEKGFISSLSDWL